jgi:glucosamine--fructose-6-phosphate aminotransferase (isomerizing)
MCGIIGMLGLNSLEFLLFDGLLQLQNRGYDSAGICTINKDKNFICTKFASNNKETALDKLKTKIKNHCNSIIGIGHTRWATHGLKTDANSHPHLDMFEKFSLVHNGIIENYSTLKVFLESKNFKFQSETDTEVVVNLISYFYCIYNDIPKAILKASQKLEGSFALCIISLETPNFLYCIRRHNPLLIGKSKEGIIITSECSGFNNLVNTYFSLDNDDLCIISKDKISNSSNKIYQELNVPFLDLNLSPYPYPHWMIKEIMDQPFSVENAIKDKIINHKEIHFDILEDIKDELKEIDNIIILGCGTSFYAGEVGSLFFQEKEIFNVILVKEGSEFNKKDTPKIGKNLVIFMSQSGETKDLFKALEICKENNILTLGLINVPESYISKQVDRCIFLNCGREVSVASTKAFTSQVITLYLLSSYLYKIKKQLMTPLDNLLKVENDIKIILDNYYHNKKILEIAEYLKNWNSIFILGKGISTFYAKEGSLKLKEIGYIHSEAYNSSALKHGPYSLITPGFPIIIFLNNDENLEKNKGIIEEIKARNGFVIVISEIIPDKYDIHLQIPSSNCFQGIYSLIYIQLISYKLALLKGHNPDMPRNLAKVVTVD